MKTKLLIVFVALVAATGGFFAGKYSAAKSWDRFFQRYVIMRRCDRVQDTVRDLAFLREGKQSELTERKELALDIALFSFVDEENIGSPTAPNHYVIETVRAARDYRAQHPWTDSNATLATNVQKVFRLAD